MGEGVDSSVGLSGMFDEYYGYASADIIPIGLIRCVQRLRTMG